MLSQYSQVGCVRQSLVPREKIKS